MRKNQKYSKEEMTIAIELYQESGLSQQKFCTREHIPFHIFKYWANKIKKEHKPASGTGQHSFIPVKVSPQTRITQGECSSQVIIISYPNGLEIKCPTNIAPQQLRVLINL